MLSIKKVNNRFLLSGNTNSRGLYFHYIFYNIHLAFSFFMSFSSYTVCDSYEYILVFKPCFWPQNKARSLCTWLWGRAVLWCLEFFIINKNNHWRSMCSNNTLFYFKIYKNVNPNVSIVIFLQSYGHTNVCFCRMTQLCLLKLSNSFIYKRFTKSTRSKDYSFVTQKWTVTFQI